MIFASDNWAGAAPQISQALSQASPGMHAAYGNGEMDRRLHAKLQDVFEHELSLFTVSTGTAANSLALAATAKPGAHVMCHRLSHIVEDECNAPELFMGGGRLQPVDGANGLIDPALLKRELARYSPDNVHHGQPTAISITQTSELGTLYPLEHISTIGEIARAHNLPFHMDGARFANALVALDTTPAELTWKRGVDLLSFGGTKNGCWCAEGLIVFRPELVPQLPFHHKRAAQLFSKNRFVSAQFNAWLEDDLWLQLARHANRMAARLVSGLAQISSIELAWPSEANMAFVIMADDLAEKMRAHGASFYAWHTPQALAERVKPGHSIYRLVTSFATTQEDVDNFLSHLSTHQTQ